MRECRFIWTEKYLELDSVTCGKDRREAEGGDKYNETENCHGGGAGLGWDPSLDSFTGYR